MLLILYGRLKTAYDMTYVTVPDRGTKGVEMEVFNFAGPGGVALSMYNTDEV